MNIKEISKPVEKQLEEFDNFFKNMMKSKVSLLDFIVGYITKKRGKRIRPLLVFLSAEACGGVNQRSHIAAAMIELLHTATLIHDDVVDEASERRGLASINSRWNNKIAVLFGDYMLAKGLLSAVDGGEFDFLKALSESVRRISEGELLQIQKSKELQNDEDTYFRIISDKTASLIGTSCLLGAMSATDDKEIQSAFKFYGEKIGLAFQIRDDLFDYLSQSNKIGKPVGNDLKEKKFTLPLIYSLNKVPKSEAREIVKMVKTGNLKKKNINFIVDFVKNNGGFEYAESKAKELITEGTERLNLLEDSPAKSALISFADFVLERDL